MSTPRKRYRAAFNARVALDALKGHKTINELASLYGVYAARSPPGNTCSNKRCRRCSRLDGPRGSMTRTSYKRSYTNKSANSKSSWTG